MPRPRTAWSYYRGMDVAASAETIATPEDASTAAEPEPAAAPGGEPLLEEELLVEEVSIDGMCGVY